jgi:MFS family permease
MSNTRRSDAYEVLKITDYRRYITGRTCITFGINVLATVVGWQVYEFLPAEMPTNDKALALGYIGLAEFVPFLIVTLIGGYIADILDRKKIIQTCVFLYSCCALLLFFLSSNFSHILKEHGVTPIYWIIGMTGLVRGFLGPAQSAFAAQLVPPQLYANAATFTTMSWHISAIGGPAVGGLLYGFSKSATSSYLLVTILALTGFILIYFIDSRHEVNQTEGVKKEGFFDSVRSGLHFVMNKQVVLGSLALDMFAVLFGGAVILLPAFAKDVLQIGPEGMGILRASPAIGALVMAGILVYYPPVKNAGKLLLYAVAGFGVCTILFAMSKSFWFSALMLAGTGFFDNVSMVIRGTVIQLFTPNEMRGRVSSVNSIFIGSSNELGAFESGVAAKLMGLVPSVIFGGSMTLLTVAITWFSAPKLRDLDLVWKKPEE